MKKMTVLITGACGMIGSQLRAELLRRGYAVIGADRRDDGYQAPGYTAVTIDLADQAALKELYTAYPITHTIHLAALAHTAGVADLSDEAYEQANVVNAKHVFEAAKHGKVLYISTVDVYGFVKGEVDDQTQPEPISIYGKTKAKGEAACRSICPSYSIYRFSPVYTDTIKRDIQKRYYLKYPNWAYQIGKDSRYQVLNVRKAVRVMADWLDTEPAGQCVVIKDDKMLSTAAMIQQEKQAGRAKHVLHIPRWMVVCGYNVLKGVLGKNHYTFLLHKAVYPLRSK